MQYPTAYRSGSKAYAGSPAFKGEPAYTKPPQQPAFSPAANDNWPLLPSKIPANDNVPLPKLPPPQTPSTSFPGVSAGALASAASRYRGLGNVVDLARLAYENRDKLADLAFGGFIVLPSNWSLCQTCGPGSVIRGQGTFSVPLPCPAPSNCWKDAGDPGGSDPMRSTNSWMLTMNPTRFFGGIQRYDLGSIYFRTGSGSALPYRFKWWPWEYPFEWWGLPDLAPVQAPVRLPDPLPYRDLPHRRDSPYRETGPAREGNPAFDPWMNPWVDPVSDPFLDPWLRSIVAQGSSSARASGSAAGRAAARGYGQGTGVTDNHSPPGPGNKPDRKPGRNPAVTKVLSAIGKFTELDEALECGWKALPKQARKAHQIKGKKVAGATMYYWNKNWAAKKGISPEATARHNELWASGKSVHQTIPNMISDLAAAAVTDGLGLTDHYGGDYAAKFTACAAQNEVTDQAIGRANKATTANLNQFRKSSGLSMQWMHIGSGPAI